VLIGAEPERPYERPPLTKDYLRGESARDKAHVHPEDFYPSYQQHVRVEHWANALHQGPAAARAMLGQQVSYDHVPYFFSDQYDVGMEYSGVAPQWDEVVFRGDRAGGEFIAFWLRDGRVAAGMNVNVWDVNADVEALIRSGAKVDAAALADPDVPLTTLLASTPPCRNGARLQ
jgi:3-phenylpropionate/trans-cinnamate dioxygenase ferredoxin reductase component